MDNKSGKASPVARAFEALYELVLYLRGENGCPWDRAQELPAIYECVKEEVGELGEALEKGDFAGLSEEWGDSVFTLLMLAAIAEEKSDFSVEQALRAIEAKMIRRHPHVFGSSDVKVVEDVLAQWDRIKEKEKQREPQAQAQSLMDSLPHFYSALKRAQHVQKIAAEVGFDWPRAEGVIEKIVEETGEIRDALAGRSEEDAADEVGDLLFSCVNLARFVGKDSEALLSKTVDKFIDRFKYIERELRRAGKTAEEASLKEMDDLWEKAKKRGGSEQ